MERGILVVILCTALSHLVLSSQNCEDCVRLTPLIEAGDHELARNLSRVDSKEFFGIESYSGFVTVKKEFNNNLFFWFFPAKTPVATTPWIIWLQGGPGFSSMLGLFDIIGPFMVKDGKVEQRNLTWANDYSLLFIDNPVGAGYSFTDDDKGIPTNITDTGAQLLEFVVQFLSVFPELRKAPLFVVGQSYAGKYVPALGVQIHRYNLNATETDRINLRGIAVGNGLIELRHMMNYSELCKNIGLLDGEEIQHVANLDSAVVNLIDTEKYVDAANKFNETIEYIKAKSGVNIYNFIKEPSKSAPLFEEYITRRNIRDLIHVGNATFTYNNQLVYEKMLPDFVKSTKPYLEELLPHYGVMAYSGQLDVILPYSLSKNVYHTMNWPKREEYMQAPRKRLRRTNNGTVVGYMKTGGNFVDILVRNAGHSVPGDQPETAKFIIDDFIGKYA